MKILLLEDDLILSAELGKLIKIKSWGLGKKFG